MKRRNKVLAVLLLGTALVVGGCGLNSSADSASTEVVAQDNTAFQSMEKVESKSNL